ncbi:hypothetical protein M5K25_006342 [Dendrobium thyrsiflorum]|uniref:Uncharacterized protein n=1 Tax=Dendrobium thyrsiflorum TaxID=117978 RepID=A0ABD0VIK4_DENTH
MLYPLSSLVPHLSQPWGDDEEVARWPIQTTTSEAREASGNPGSGENSNLIRQKEDQEVETQKGKERMPSLEPVPMGESGKGYGEKREEVEQERRCDDLERRGVEFERERGNYDQRGTASKRGGHCYDTRDAKFERRKWEIDEGLGHLEFD